MSNLLGIFVLGHYGALYTQNDTHKNDVILMHNLITERTPAAPWWCRNAGMVRARLFSLEMGYLGHAWCRLDSQILARNGVFVVMVGCKSKTTQSELCLDEASAVCQARTPRRRRMRIRS